MVKKCVLSVLATISVVVIYLSFESKNPKVEEIKKISSKKEVKTSKLTEQNSFKPNPYIKEDDEEV